MATSYADCPLRIILGMHFLTPNQWIGTMTDLSAGPMESIYSDYVPSDDVTIPFTATASTKRLARTIQGAPPRSLPVPDVTVDDSLDDLLTDFSKATLKERYLTEDESFQDRFANSVRYYANDQEHAQRMYGYISRMWCMPSTPILSNGGNLKGNLISCFVNEAPDSMTGIIDTWSENAHIGSKGGGIGTCWSNVRGIAEKIKANGKTSGAQSFMKVQDSMVSCINQGSNRRGAGAVYLDMKHPDIEVFVDMRRITGGDPDRKCFNLHHGIFVSDAFMQAADRGEPWDLISPHTGNVVKTIDARELFEKIVITRLETGEPYIVFEDAVRRATPEHHKKSGLYPKTSNLCSEITLPTGVDHHGIERTAICCLFQPNAAKFDEWSKDPHFFKDILYFLDNVLEDFIENSGEAFNKARYSARQERSVGVGMMGWHSFLQSKEIPMESVMAKVWNKKIFKHAFEQLDKANYEIALERGACPDAAEHGIMKRFSYVSAGAPTATVSIICQGTSASIDPIPANIYTHKTLDGSFEVKNQHLEKLLDKKGKNTKDIWKSILEQEGSVQHLDFLDQNEKDCYKTAFEIDTPRSSRSSSRSYSFC